MATLLLWALFGLYSILFVMSSFSLRIPDDLMEEAKKLAAENSTSLNQFFLVTIAAKIGEAKTKKYFERRSQLADIDAVRAILERVPDGSP